MLQAILVAVILSLSACATENVVVEGCEPSGSMQPVCGMQSPEDIAALPDGRHLLLAHFGGMFDATGSLSLFDTQTEDVKPLFPQSGITLAGATAPWGDPKCKPPELDKFSPHGTHLHRLTNGRLRYLVVNHGGREAIELFEVIGEGGNISLLWQGCVEPSKDTFMNDVVGLSNGDLIYTRMFHNGGMVEQLLSLLGLDTGDLWRWNQEAGLRALPGTKANQPNGIEVAPDQRHVFANMYFTQELWKVDADTGEVVGTAPLANADNSAWGTDGRLWVVTHTDSMSNMLACFGNQEAACGASFAIIAVDPDSLEIEKVFEHRGPPMGAATVAVPQAGRIYMGSFVGDRMVSIPDFTQ